jgi:quercetin dioxygenase-like cupin family protein
MATEPGKGPPGGGAPCARRAGRGTSIWYMGCLFTVLAASDDTGGRFGLLEMVVPKGREPSRHLHRQDDEGFYVLEGNLTFYVGEEVYEAGPGAFVFLPRGVPHSYVFETDEVRMLGIVAPGGLEGHFRDPRFAEAAESPTLPPATAITPPTLFLLR